jgi:hypothetical protein
MNDDLKQRLVSLAEELRPSLWNEKQDCSITISFDANGTTVSWIVNDGQGGSDSSHRRLPLLRKPS